MHGSCCLAFSVNSLFLVGLSFYTKQHLVVIKIFEELLDDRGVTLGQGMKFLGKVFTEELDVVLIHLIESLALLRLFSASACNTCNSVAWAKESCHARASASSILLLNFCRCLVTNALILVSPISY